MMPKNMQEKLNILEPKFKNQISQLLENIGDSVSALYDIATRDEKTGIYNHRFFKTIFEMELEKARRNSKNKFSLIVIDIDFFKKFNDTYGHLVGDEILKELAGVLQKEIRKYDILARFGGEEFFVLLPNTKIQRAKKVAERLRKNLWKNKKLKKYKVTISLGVTEYKPRDKMSTAVKRADNALYDSKRNGRNQVSVKV